MENINEKPRQRKVASEELDFNQIHKINPFLLKDMHPVYQEAYQKAQGITQGKRITMDNQFTNFDLHKDREKVLQKIEFINSMKQDEGVFEATVQADILEALVYDMIHNHSWLGENVGAILPSVYDDLFSGNDIIVSHKTGEATEYSGVGIDLTLGEVAFMKKLEDTMSRIRGGSLGKVKYFKSEDERFVGELRSIPHLVIGVDREKLFKLCRLWINGDYNRLKQDATAKIFIQMMIAQCDEFIKLTNIENIIKVYTREKRILGGVLAKLK
ncbi:MAG: hypothetical protein QG614_77 [Patescibacteria group bacterium]|nr:hypothetical protein [Patescibacteria group bacterium]